MSPWDIRWEALARQAGVRPPHCFHLWHAIASDPATFDPQTYATFARMELRHVEAMVAALRSSGLMPEPKRRIRASAGHDPIHAKPTRLAPIMQLPDTWLAYAQERRQWDKATTEDVLADFIEHWSNRTDARAAKIDWEQCWQTWVRRDRRDNGSWQPAVIPIDQSARLSEYAEFRRKVGRE